LFLQSNQAKELRLPLDVFLMVKARGISCDLLFENTLDAFGLPFIPNDIHCQLSLKLLE
jgi:hypothetical protein